LLDGAEQPAQVTPFVPSGPGSMVIVTSNHLLEELVYDGAMPVPVDPLEDESATRLLVDIVGRERVEAEPDAVSRLVELCGRLPLALRVCGAHLVGRHRHRSVAWVVDQIEAADDRLAAIGGSGHHDLAAVFDFAYQALEPAARALYRAIGLMPSARFAEPAARAVAGLDADAHAAALAELVEVSLVRTADGGRCSVHELAHRHARITGHRRDGPAAQAQGTRRLLDWYLAALRAADRAVAPDRLRLAPHGDPRVEGVPTFTDPKAAFAWFSDERNSIQGVLRLAVDIAWDERVWHLTEPLWSFVYNLKSYGLWFEAYEAAARAGERLGDRSVVARMRSCLARAYSDHGDFGRAAQEMAVAEDAVSGVDDTMLRGSIAEFSGIMAFERGDIADAVAHFQLARRLHADAGSDRGAALEQYQLGKCYAAMGSASKALEAYEASERVFVEIGDTLLATRVMRRRAEALRMAGRDDDAVRAASTALAASQDLGLPFDEAEALELSASLAETMGHADIARDRLRRAADIYSHLNHPRARTLLSELGEASGS
ncbi:MAG TPA: hypothetical protein VK507_00415, partial [Iamia sp.]|nr:hypothetical protein [Iamia sp.]